jgi:hypothetical protein
MGSPCVAALFLIWTAPPKRTGVPRFLLRNQKRRHPCDSLTAYARIPYAYGDTVALPRSREYVRHFTFPGFVNSGALHYPSADPRPPFARCPSPFALRPLRFAPYQVETGINTSPRSNFRGMKSSVIPYFRVDTPAWCGTIGEGWDASSSRDQTVVFSRW